MKLTLTIMNDETQLNQDIEVNSQQRIIDTLLILKEAGRIPGIVIEAARVKSTRRGMYLEVQQTYEEEQINTGDIFELI